VTLTRVSGAIGVDPDAPLIRSSDTAIRRVGLQPRFLPTGGGSDANIGNDKGIEAVNLGVGYKNVHSSNARAACDELRVVCGAGSTSEVA